MLEHVLAFSIRHRWLVVILTIAAAALGVAALQRLPIDAVPDVTGNQVVVTTVAPGLGPEEIEKQVTFPVESALAGTPRLIRTRSLSRNGFSQVSADFEDGVDIYFARQQVSERLLEAKESIPAGIEPRLGAVSTGVSNVYLWALSFAHPNGKSADDRSLASDAGQPGWQPDGTYLTLEGQPLRTDQERLTYLRTVQDWIVKPQIKQVKDVADVDVLGGHVKQYVVEPNPAKLVAYGITLKDLSDALERNNQVSGGSFIERRGEAALLRIDARITDAQQIGQVALKVQGGTPLLVRDVAEVVIGHEVRAGASTLNGQEVVSGIAMMLTGANSRTVAAGVDEKLKHITLPPDMVITPILNRQKLVDSTIHTVATNLAEGAILVVVVLLLLLGNLRAALLTALAIPLSMLLTASGMIAGKISGNLMSLGAIDFGLIVDGAVIIVENCIRMLAERQKELGRPLNTAERLQTVLLASRQVRSATAFGEAIIIIVYLPILTLSGVEGKMFWPMAMTVVLALVAAFILSLTFVPAMVAICLRGRISERENPLLHLARKAYEPTLRLALRGRWAVVLVALALVIGSALWFGTLGSVFVPRLDEGDINITTARSPAVSLTEAVRLQKQIERIVRQQIPEAINVLSATGTGDAAQDAIPQFEADTFIILKPKSQWRSEAELDKVIEARKKELTASGIYNSPDTNPAAAADPDGLPTSDHKGKLIQLMQLELSAVPGTTLEFSQPIEDRFNEIIAGVRSDIAVEVYGEDLEQMRTAAGKVAELLRKIPGSADVKVEATDGLPVLKIEPDRKAISRLGVNAGDIGDLVLSAVEGKKAGVVYEGDRRFDLVLRLPELIRNDPKALAALPVPLPRSSEGSGPSRSAAASAVVAAGMTDRPAVLPLSSMAHFSTGESLYEVKRQNGKRHVLVQCNVRDRDLGSFVDEARPKVDTQVHLPAGNWIEWGGQFETYAAARQRLAIVVPVSLLLIFALLFISFGDVVDALLVFSGVPLALTGGIAALAIRDMPFSISAGVGFIALSGVAVLNGLVMVSFIRQLRSEGLPLDEAIRRGCVTRLRPVLMTALVATLGFVPMAIASGSGAEVQRPLATVVIGGILSCTLLTLVVLPALYRLVHRTPKPLTA